MRAHVGRGRVGLLLASSSVAALLIGGGAPPALAACSTSFTNTTSAGCTNAATITGISINNSTITSTITNTGTISPNGVVLTNASTVVGGIVGTSGTINGGISIDSSSRITAGGSGIAINQGNFTGGISNAGTIAVGGGVVDIIVGSTTQAGAASGFRFDIPTFADGITNSGTLTGARFGVVVGGIVHATSTSLVTVTISTFSNGVTNTGTITASLGGIVVGGNPGGGSGGNATVTVSRFSGNVSNSGVITATDGIVIGGSPFFGLPHPTVTISTFAAGVVNSGTISASRFGMVVGGSSSLGGELMIANLTGPISNSGSISAGGGGIVVGGDPKQGGIVTVLTVTSGVTNSGSIQGGAFGIAVGGSASFGGQVNITSFGGGVVNEANGSIVVTGIGIEVGGSGVTMSTFAGGIANSGTIQGATGIRVDSGARSFIGAIANSGTISGSGGTAIDVSLASNAMTINQAAGLISGDIKLSTHADVLNVTGGTVSGNIIGAGSSNTVNFAPGAGNTFIYASGFGVSGVNQININSGTVVLNGTNSATSVDVVGGTLAGTGTLDPLAVTIHSGATFAPGNGTPGTSMAITGNLTFQSGATYQVQFNPTTASFATVSGTVTLAGTVLASFAPGSYVSKQYTILQSGGLSGTFANLTTQGAPAGFTASLSQNADDVFLNLALGVAAPGNALNVNQANVVNAIAAAFNSGGALPPGFVSVLGLTGSAQANALNELSGESSAGFFQGAFQAGNGFLGLMVNPFLDGRFGNNGGFGAAMGFAADEPPALPQAAAAFASAMPVKAAPMPATFEQRFSVWGAAYGGSGRVLGDPVVGSHDTSASAAAFAAGVDYRLAPDTVVGFALAGGGTSWNVTANLGGGHSDMFQAGVYGSQRWGAAYLSGALAYNFHDVTTNRTITVAGTDMLQARFQANGVGARLEGGNRYATPWVGITPYAAAQVQSIALPNYGETATAGSNQFALNFASQTATATRTELGAWLDKKMLMDNGALLTLYGRAAWAHDFGNSPSVSAIFQTLPGSNFIVNGAVPARDGALVTGAAQYSLASGWAFLAKFDGEFSSTTSIYTGSGMVKKTW